ncbi:MAG TPA: methyltransferase domain-containing protein [Actinomycetes bacterium]|jgi:ubiquinone/menaquinone biosynthesis C-methylase UbiE
MLGPHFDRWAPHYDDSVLLPLYQAAHDAVLVQAAAVVGPRGRILDVGCGTGRLMEAATRRFPHATVTGVDLSGTMLSVAVVARRPGARLRFVRAEVEHLPFADAAFDLVVSTYSFRHWAEPCAGTREIARVLRPQGVFVVADVSDPPRRGVLGRMSRRRPRVPEACAVALANADLTVVRTGRVAGFGPITESVIVLATRRERKPGRVSAIM